MDTHTHTLSIQTDAGISLGGATVGRARARPMGPSYMANGFHGHMGYMGT